MSGHMKGPWKIQQESIDPSWHIITAAGGRIIANVHIEAGNPMDRDNANLLMAAPELLAALYEARDRMLGSSPAIVKLRDMADAAIAKATGGVA